MEFTELMMMETDDFTSANDLDWLQEEVEADYCHYWDSLLLPVSSSAGSIQQLSGSSSSESGTLTINPSPSSNSVSVTDLGRGDDIVEAGGNMEKPVKRRSRASSKKIPATKHYINATAKNFKELVQKHTGRPAGPPPFTIFGGSNYCPTKGPMAFINFGAGDAA